MDTPPAAAGPSAPTGATRPGALGDLAERAMRSALLTLSHRRALGRLATGLPITRAMVRRFVAGETLEDALPAIQRLHAHGLATTVDVLGESVAAEAEARAACARYLAVLTALADRGLDRNVSLKPSQMGLKIDERLAHENVAAVVGRAVETGAFVRIDMEDSGSTDRTLALWRELRPPDRSSGADVGVVLQAALRRTEADIDELIAARGRVRLCKGAYKEPETVAFQDKADVDAAYERLMIRLLHEGTYPALATHDVRLINRAVDVARVDGISRDAFEFQMLYGVRRDLQEQLAGAGWRVRVYVPFGAEWYPYFMRRLAERPANVSFLVRNLWRDRSRG